MGCPAIVQRNNDARCMKRAHQPESKKIKSNTSLAERKVLR
jgi:hypothetical protein